MMVSLNEDKGEVLATGEKLIESEKCEKCEISEKGEKGEG
jgi:hypothetical protein